MKPCTLALLFISVYVSSCGGSAEKDLQGSWLGGCVLGQKESWLFEDLDYTYSVFLYEDNQCTELAQTRTFYGTFNGGNSVENPEGAKTFEYQIVRATLKPETDSAAAALATANFCSVTTWTKGTEEDVTDKTCSGFSTSKNVPTYSTYKITDNVVNFGRQTDGATDDGTTKDKRHLSLSALLLSKQSSE